jgi:hypothetical protein
MNITFSIHRFYALFLRYWAENKTALLLVFLLSLPIVYLNVIGNGRIHIGRGSINGGLSVYMIVFLYFAFRCVDNKERLAYFLLLPASRLEKFLFLLFAGVLLPYLLILSEIYVVKTVLDFIPFNLVRQSENVIYFNSFSTFLTTCFIFSVIITVRFLLKQVNILRSVFLLMAVAMIHNVVNQLIVNSFFGSHITSAPFGNMKFEYGDKALIDVGLYTDFLPYSAVLFGCFWAAMLYVAFMKFREMEKGL